MTCSHLRCRFCAFFCMTWDALLAHYRAKHCAHKPLPKGKAGATK